MSILVTGGAGYIGSILVEELIKKERNVVVLDNLCKGHRMAIHPKAEFIKGDIADDELLDYLLSKHRIDAVIHFAAQSLVGESVENPQKYYHDNVIKSIRLLDSMIRNSVKCIIFSSTAAIYGDPINVPILETDPTHPINPYGKTKLLIESVMEDYDKAFGLKYVSLRYFNAAGTSENYGEDHYPETHLIPIVLEVVQGKRKCVTVFGDDYPTEDGTCIRDYIHVIDLAIAHILALEYLKHEMNSNIFNLGNGNGHSVKEVVDIARKVTGHKIPVTIGPRRPGDPARLVASSEKIKKVLNWEPRYPELQKIIESAYKWKQRCPNGYEN